MKLLSVMVLALVACGLSPVRYSALNAPPRAMSPRPVDEVELFRERLPSRPFVEVGLLEFHGSAENPSSESTVATWLKKEAAKRGCDGVVVDKLIHERGTCIVYRYAPVSSGS